jgi:hypothetical protein
MPAASENRTLAPSGFFTPLSAGWPQHIAGRIAYVERVDGDSTLLQALASPRTYPGHPPVTAHETHASVVFVAAERAYKLKKPLKLGFLDHSTLALRHAACREEVRVNSELAPRIYLGVRAILRTPCGVRLADEQAPGAVEYAVEMRSFSDADTLAGALAQGDAGALHIAEVARRLADFHRRAPIVAGGGPEEVLRMWRANIGELRAITRPTHWRIDVLEGFGQAFVRAHAREIQRRASEGRVRDGHGDLRCEHVLLAPTVQIVDRIEFNPELRHTDVACDLAFLTMDLRARRRSVLARELVAAYRHAGGNPGSEALRSFYGAHCALVRAKVALIAAAQRDGAARRAPDARRHVLASDTAPGTTDTPGTNTPDTGIGGAAAAEAERLWRLAERLCWRARRPLVLVVCGPAASGKSTLADALARRSGIPVLRSDEVRKRLAGIAPGERGRTEHYSEQFTHATYEQLSREALALLDRRDAVIVDATCRSRRVRAVLLRRLHAPGAIRVVVRCQVPLATALGRARRRMQDEAPLSDATPRIVREQYESFEELDELPADSVLTVQGDRPPAEQVAEVAGAVDRALADTPSQPRAA